MATCSICTMKVVDLAMHLVARHSQPTLTREGRDLSRYGLGEQEEMTFTNIKMRVVGQRIAETLRLERFVVTTQQQHPGIMGKSKLNKATENIEAIQMVHNDLEQYVIREEGAKILYTSSQARRLYYKLNRKQGRHFQEIVPYQFVEKLLERYHREGLEFPCVKEEPVEEAGGNAGPSTSLSRKREIRGFEEEGEEATQASTRRVSTGVPLMSDAELANLRLRIQQQIRKIENKSP